MYTYDKLYKHNKTHFSDFDQAFSSVVLIVWMQI